MCLLLVRVRRYLPWVLILVSLGAVAADGINFDRDRGLLSVSLRDQPLQSVLEKISSASDVEFFFHAAATDAISPNFSELPLEDALRQLLRDRSYVLVRAATEQKPHAFKVWLLATHQQGQAPRIVPKPKRATQAPARTATRPTQRENVANARRSALEEAAEDADALEELAIELERLETEKLLELLEQGDSIDDAQLNGLRQRAKRR